MKQEKPAYKAIFVPVDLHTEVKIGATKRKLNMINFIKHILKTNKQFEIEKEVKVS